jgi:hypothetical protein
MVVCGGWMLLGVLGDGVCVVRADSDDSLVLFPAMAVAVFCLVFVYFFFSQFIFCNRLILYGLLSLGGLCFKNCRFISY